MWAKGVLYMFGNLGVKNLQIELSSNERKRTYLEQEDVGQHKGYHLHGDKQSNV